MSAERADSPGVPFPPPLVYVAALALGFLMHRAVPAGIAPARYRPNQPATTIVESGPYRWSRNPMYVAMALLSAGVACVFNALWPLLLVPLAVLVTDRYTIAGRALSRARVSRRVPRLHPSGATLGVMR